MNTKKVIFCFIIINIFISTIFFSLPKSYAVVNIASSSTADQAIGAMGKMQNGGTVDANVSTKLKKIANSILAILQIVGSGIALIMVTVFGIRYILTSPSEKADAKKQIFPMLIGAVLLFAGVNLLQIVANVTYETAQNL